MATVTKDFRVKAGLVVEGSTATVNGHDILTEALVDAKGDLLVASGADAVTRLAAGTDNYILTADSNATNGIAWKAPQAVGVFDTQITFEGATANDYETTLTVEDPTADRTITLPNVSGTVITTGDTGTVTNTMLAGSIANEKLTNSSITINGTSVSLGGSRTLGTDDVSEGSTNKYFTDERAQDAVGNSVGTGLSYNDGTGAISVTANTYDAYGSASAVAGDLSTHISDSSTHGVSGDIVGTSDSQTLTNKTISGSSNTLSNIGNSSLTNDSITINGTATALGGSRTLGSDDIAEGSTNKYFTDERAQDAIGNAVGNGLDYDDSTGAISVDPSEFALNAVGAPTGNVSMATYKITSLGTPTDSTDAATKAYVDSVTEGLHIHESVVAATTTNVNLANALENGDILDGVTLATTNRILVKNQTNKAENGIYVVQASGQPTRATDFDTATEVDSGDFVFVYGGTANASTGWVQTNRPATIGTDEINFTQFSGAGTYLAGNGLTLTGNSFSINTAVTADVSTAQTLTNKTIDGGTNTLSNIANGSLTNSAITINGTSTSLGGTRTLVTDDIAEDGSPTNLWFTDERAQDAVGNAVGTGLSYNDSTGAISNSGVLSITGTSNQVTADVSTGAVTLSLPQSIHSAATPTFGGVTVGSVTLTDALMGTALATASDSATTIDSWSATTYSSAKYLVQMKKGSDIEVIEVLVTVDGSNNVYLTEYADVISNNVLGTTNAVYSGGNVLLQVTGTTADTAVKVHKTYIEA
jgi:hypothetical protein